MSTLQYTVLPTTTSRIVGSSGSLAASTVVSTRLGRRYMWPVAAAVLLSLSLYGLFNGLCQLQLQDVREAWPEDRSFPPLYEEFHRLERDLPQHNLSLPEPEGKHRKFLWMANHVYSVGWGNALQEVFLNAHLAHASKRAFVFDNYTWARPEAPDYSQFRQNLIPSRIPMSAMISGPIVGGELPQGDDVPRAVSREYFQKVCPNRTVIHSDVVNAHFRWASAGTILEQWLELLDTIDDPCLEIDAQSSQIFDIWVFGTTRVLDIWPTLFSSPMLTGFNWSPLVQSAFEANAAALSPSRTVLSSLLSFLPSASPEPTVDPYSMEPIPGLLALHVRRGDFSDHCHHLATWSSTYMSFNLFHGLPDTFKPPPGAEWGWNTPENHAIYLAHCFPSVEQIVDKVHAIRTNSSAGIGLRRVYIMTNAPRAWVNVLKSALHDEGQWDAVVSSRDLEMTWEQKHVAQAIDMMIGQRAQVFVGNGFSSLSSNVVMLRIMNGFSLLSTRFWGP